MGRSLWLGVFIACVIFAVAASQNEVTADPTSPTDTLLPVPESANQAPPPGAVKPHDPFTLHSSGSAGAVWQYEDLSPEEQAVVDRGFDTTTWGESQKVLAAAAMQNYPAIAAKRAQLLLGISDLANAGVVP